MNHNEAILSNIDLHGFIPSFTFQLFVIWIDMGQQQKWRDPIYFFGGVAYFSFFLIKKHPGNSKDPMKRGPTSNSSQHGARSVLMASAQTDVSKLSGALAARRRR